MVLLEVFYVDLVVMEGVLDALLINLKGQKQGMSVISDDID